VTSATAIRTPPPAATAFAADVGGTWVRLRTGGAGAPVERFRSPSRLNHPGRPVARLREDMVGLLCRAAPPDAHAAVSFGAAIDHLTGTVYGSAPLWGSEAAPYDLRDVLRHRRPDVTCGYQSTSGACRARSATSPP
jgi:hypothetical protein